MKHSFQQQDDLKKDMERLRYEQGEVYRLFTENDQKIIRDYLENKSKVDADVAAFKTQIGVFDNTVQTMHNTLDKHNLVV